MKTVATSAATNVSGNGAANTPAALSIGLAHVGAGDLTVAGGKAANLGELIQAGFPVPPGFVVTTAAYDRVVAANGLGPAISQVSQPEQGAPLRAAFEAASIPPEVEEAILAGYRQFGVGAVAVRSSATAEDLPEAAFAGQQETYLGILDEKALLSAVRRCWASLWTERAIAYRKHLGIDHAGVKLAVVVQRLVAADAAGVLFTANPVSGARDEIVIDATSGLGESIVAGLVTPDQMTLRRGRLGWRIVERRRGRREVEIRPRAGGGTEEVVPADSHEPAMADAAYRRLARLGEAIARHFGLPQDIEWAWADGEPYILQARPITALPEPVARRGGFSTMQGGPAEYMQVRPYPLDVTTWMPAMSTALMRMLPLGGAVPPLDQLWIAEDGVIRQFAGFPGLRPSVDLLLAPVKFLALAARYDPAHWRDDPVLAAALARAHELESRDPPSLTWEELLATARDAMAFPAIVVELRRRYFPRSVLALGALLLILRWLGYGNRLGTLLSGVDNKTLEANRALERLAAGIRADPTLAALFAEHEADILTAALDHDHAGQAFLAKLNTFLDDYGHRETASPILVSAPTWKDAPEVVLGALKGLALAEPPQRGQALAWEAARDEVLTHPTLRFPLLRKAFLTALTEARRFPALREDTHFAMTMAMPPLRRTLLEMGRRVAEAGVLDTPQDVFHLMFNELERAAGSWPPPPALAAELRAAALIRAERRAELADTPLIDNSRATAATPVGDALLAGTPGSPGVAEGPVRLVREAAQFGALRPGEVLVAPYTNPSWTPLFGRAAAVIVDTGSAASHAAIVAREYGIPAVMGAAGATALLSDGQRVRVDGGRGLVFPAVLDIGDGLDRPAGG